MKKIIPNNVIIRRGKGQKPAAIIKRYPDEHYKYMSDLSHELRAPLTSMRGLLESLSDGLIKDEETRLRYYRLMLKEIERLTRLISDMTALDRLSIEARPNEVEIEARPMIEDLLDSFRAQAKELGMEIECDAFEGVTLLSDKDKLEQLMIIMIDNALAHSHRGGVIKVSVYDSKDFKPRYNNFTVTRSDGKFPPEGKRAILSVEDPGGGIAPEAMPHLFERFFKADPAREGSGSGLGLAIAKRIADNLGETVIIESEQGKGTRVSVSVKRA